MFLPSSLKFLRIVAVFCLVEDDLVVASDLLFSELGEISQFPLKIIRHLCDVLFRISVSALVEHNISYLFLSFMRIFMAGYGDLSHENADGHP